MKKIYEIFDNSKKFGIKWWLNDELGSVSLYFDGVWYPKEPFDNYNLHTIFSNFKHSVLEPCYIGRTNKDFGEQKFNAKMYDNSELKDMLLIETAELTGFITDDYSHGGLVILLAFSGDTERLFFSFDLGNTYQEIRLKRNSFKNLVLKLPNLK